MDLHKPVIYIHLDRIHTNQGSCFHGNFFIFLQRRGRAAELAMGRQIEWSHGSCLGRADQTAAKQAEWAVECLSSCRVHSTQWKATHLVKGPLSQCVPTLTLLRHHNRVTKSQVVRNWEPGCQKLVLASWKHMVANNEAWCQSAMWSCLV